MSEFVTAAEKGSKKAMVALLEANKDRAYALALLLLSDGEKAAKITKDVINQSWDKITVKGLYSDEVYAAYIMTEVAFAAAGELFGNNPKTFRVSKADVAMPEIKGVEFTGKVTDGISELRDALGFVSPAESFVFLLKSAGMSLSDIAKVIVQRDAAAGFFYASAVKNLDDKFDAEKAESLCSKYLAEQKLPDEAVIDCKTVIKKRARFEMPSKRAMTAIISGICVLALALMAFFLIKELNFPQKYDGTVSEAGELYHVATALDENKTYYADIAVKDYGTITVKLDQKSAPNTAANFVELAEKGFYDGLTFHRIMEGFMMQGGCPDGDGTGDPGYSIEGEFAANGFQGNTLSHKKGIISMARGNDKNSAGCQFFIMHDSATHLDGNYAAFGEVTKGMDIVDKICTEAEPTDDNGTIPADDQPIIESVTIRSE